MSLEELHERNMLMRQLLDASKELQALNRKHGRTESLDLVNLNPSAMK